MRFAASFTAKGSQTAKSFKWWFDNIFVAETEELRSDGRHVLLVLDNHKSHLMSPDDVQRAVQLRIIVFLLTNTTQDCAILDVSVFGPFKSALRKLQRQKYDGSKDFKDQVLPILAEAIVKTFTETTIKKGFVEAGVLTLNSTGEYVLSPSPDILVSKLDKLVKTKHSMLHFEIHVDEGSEKMTL